MKRLALVACLVGLLAACQPTSLPFGRIGTPPPRPAAPRIVVRVVAAGDCLSAQVDIDGGWPEGGYALIGFESEPPALITAAHSVVAIEKYHVEHPLAWSLSVFPPGWTTSSFGAGGTIPC